MPKQRRRNQISRQLKREARDQKAQARFIESPTPKKAWRIAGAEANKEYKPVLRGLRSEVAGSRKREGELKDWYGGLTAQNQAAQQSAAATSQAAESALTQRLANASASDSSNLKDLASQNEATAKLLGGPTNSRGLAEAAAGNTAVAQQRVALTSPLTAERASNQGYLAQRGISASERGIEARKAETSRRRKIKEDLRAGKKERGQAVVANLEKLREGARDYAIQKQAFGQKGKELGQEAREGAADRRLKSREGAADRSIDAAKVGISQAKLGLEQRKTNQAGRKVKREERKFKLEKQEAAGGGKGVSPDKRSAMSEAKALYRSESPPATDSEWAKFQSALAEKGEINPADAAWAVKRLRQQDFKHRQKTIKRGHR